MLTEVCSTPVPIPSIPRTDLSDLIVLASRLAIELELAAIRTKSVPRKKMLDCYARVAQQLRASLLACRCGEK